MAIIRYRDSHGRFCSRATASRLSNLHRPVSTEVSKPKSQKTSKITKAYIKPADIKPGKPLPKPAPPPAPSRRRPEPTAPPPLPPEPPSAPYDGGRYDDEEEPDRPSREPYSYDEEPDEEPDEEREFDPDEPLGGFDRLDGEEEFFEEIGVVDVDTEGKSSK